MIYFENNMESIKFFQPGLYEGYQKKHQLFGERRLEEIQSINSRDEERIINIRINSTEYRLNSAYRPLEEARKWAEQYEFRNLSTVVAMFGFGNGIMTRALSARMREEDYLLIYEPCAEIFEHVLNNYDITDIAGRKSTVIIVEDINDVELHRSLYNMIDLQNIKSQVQCIYPNYDRIFAESCLKFYKTIKGCFTSARININTSIYFGEKYIDNTLKNIGFLEEGISLPDLGEFLPRDFPAIVVAAGPSVRDNLDELKKAKGKAVIFAVDRILDYLLDEGVVPDFVVTIDPMKKLEHFSLREDITIPLICYLESNPEVLFRHKGKKILCSNSAFLEELYHMEGRELPRLATSGSVAIVTYRACVALGFPRVILVGQDLAYSNGMSHAGGATEEIYQEENILVDGVKGEMVRSRHDWKEFIIQYQDLIAFHSDVEVIDAKEKGARIKGAIVMSLEEAMKRYGNSGVKWEFAIPESKMNFIRMENIKKFLEDNLPILEKIKRKAQAAIEECDKAIRVSSIGSSMDKIYKKLSAINEYIEDQKIYLFLNSYISGKTAQQLAEIGVFTEDIEKNSENTFKTSKAVYQATVDAVDYTKVRVENALKALERGER